MLLAAAALRFVGLGDIDRKVFDEKYYVTQAQERLDGLEPVDRPAHPPLGTWMIAGGIAGAGDDPFGWRVVPALAGVASAALAAAVAWTALRRRWIALLAAGFVAVDGLAVVTSRFAILDGLQPPFALLAVFAALRWRRDGHLGWIMVAGASAGAMTAVKWNGVLLLGILVLWCAAVAFRGRRSASSWRAAAVPGVLVAVAAVVYVGSYASWFVDYADTETAADRCAEDGECGTDAGDRLRGWWWEQWERVDYHDRLEATHPDRATALEWPLLSQPVTVYLARCTPEEACAMPPDHTTRILAAGNPALWWPAFLAVPVIATLAWRRRRTDLALLAAMPLVLWLPWAVSPKPGFHYFMTPVVPFLAIVLSGALGAIGRRRIQQFAVATVVVAVAAVAIWHAPLTYGWELDETGIEMRNLFPSWPE